MRPKLKGDTFYIPVPDGIYLRNNQGPFKIKGKVVYRWLEHLIPYLNGEHTLEEITQGLPEEKRVMVNNLINILFTNGFIKDVAFAHPHTLSTTEKQLYAPEIAFIDSFVDSAAYRFEQFRESRVLLIGSGLALTALVHANLKSGIRRLAVLTTEECPTNRQRHYEYLDLFNQRGSRQQLVEVKALQWSDENEVKEAIQPFNVVISFSDRPMLARARMLNKLCRAEKKISIQAVIVDNHAWIGPLLHSETAGCWECAWRRLQVNLPHLSEQFPQYAFQDHPTDPISRFVAMPTAAIVANELSFEIFKHLTGTSPLEIQPSLLTIDLETLQTENHSFLPHPLCRSCQTPRVPTSVLFQDTLCQLELGNSLDQETFSKRAATCFDSRLGLFNSLAEHDFIQLPLNISQVVISHPLLLEPPQKPIVITGVGTDLSMPRLRATQRACEIYAASIIDPQQLLEFERAQKEQYVMQADWLLANTAVYEAKQWTWALDLRAGNVHLVPAPLVYPGLRSLAPSEKTAPGLASGLSWSEAVSQALMALCKQVTIMGMGTTQKPFPQLDIAAMHLDAEGARYRHMLEIMRETVNIYDVTGPLQVPTLAFCVGETTLTYSSHLDILEAMRVGLEQVVQHFQSKTNHQPEYALPVAPNLPANLQGTHLIVPEYQAPSGWLARREYLQQTIDSHGYRAFAVPLHTDPALTDILPYIVHVLLARS